MNSAQKTPDTLSIARRLLDTFTNEQIAHRVSRSLLRFPDEATDVMVAIIAINSERANRIFEHWQAEVVA